MRLRRIISLGVVLLILGSSTVFAGEYKEMELSPSVVRGVKLEENSQKTGLTAGGQVIDEAAMRRGLQSTLNASILGLNYKELVRSDKNASNYLDYGPFEDDGEYPSAYPGEWDAHSPISWKQGEGPFARDYFEFSGTDFADASCGMHSFAVILLKSGYVRSGFTAKDAYGLALDYGMGSNYYGMPAYNWERVTEATGGYLEHVATVREGNLYEEIREAYRRGEYVIISTSINGVGHLVALDYVDKDGNIVIIDSAIRANSLDQMGAVHYIVRFKADRPSHKAPRYWMGEMDAKEANLWIVEGVLRPYIEKLERGETLSTSEIKEYQRLKQEIALEKKG